MHDVKRSFLSLSLEPWLDVWHGRHYLMWHLSQDHPVLFAGAQPELRGLPSAPGGPAVTHVERNLYAYTTPRCLPRIGRFAWLDRWTRRRHASHLRQTFDQLKWTNPVLYVWHPSFAYALDAFPDWPVVYHPYDDFAMYAAPDWLALCKRGEAALLERAALVLTSGESIRASLPRTHEVHSLPHGVSMEWYDAARDAPPPPEYEGLPRPLLVYIGCLNIRQINFALLERLARERPAWHFALVGPWVGEHDEHSRAFFARPNMTHVPARHPRELAAYAIHADVCLMTYREKESYAAGGFPLKMFEYLASGRPVVSSPLDAVRPYAPTVRLAQAPTEWLAALEAALTHDTPHDAAERIALARQNDWRTRRAEVERHLDRVAPVSRET